MNAKARTDFGSDQPQHRAAFSRLIAPRSIEEFAACYERAPLHVSRNEPGRYDPYFSVAEMERVLLGCELHAQDLQIIKDGTAARTQTYTRARSGPVHPLEDAQTSIVHPDRVSALLAGGCTVVLDHVNKYSPSMARLCRELELFFGCGVNPNVYMTPPGNQGFAVHYDTHDALVIQVAGSKHWRVYESAFRLPLEHQYWNKALYPAGNVALEMEMQPGDFLYIPRGCLHEAKANEELSLHVTIGLYPALWANVAADALMRAAETLAELRESASPSNADAVAQQLASALSAERLVEALQRLGKRWRSERDNALDGQLEQLAALPRLGDSSIVSRRAGLSYEWTESDRGVTLAFSGKSLSLPKCAAAIIRKLEAADALALPVLCEEGEAGRKVVRKLIQEGFAVQRLGERYDSSAIA